MRTLSGVLPLLRRRKAPVIGCGSCPKRIHPVRSSSPAAAASSAATGRRPAAARAREVRAVDIKPLDEWYQRLRRRREPRARLSLAGRLPRGGRRRRPRLQPRRRHGRDGLHREQQGALHALGADQHPPARWPPATPASSASSTPRRPASTPPTSRTTPEVPALARGGRLPGDAGGRLRLGEAVQRAHVPPLPRGLRPRDPGRPLPQRLRPARHLRRRPREGAGGDLPQGRRGEADRRPRDRDLGRRRADPQLHVHRRLRRGHAD